MSLNAELILNLLHGSEPRGFRELRAFRGRHVFREFYELPGTAKLIADADTFADRDVFVGVAPRTERRGGADAVEHCHALWADCDSTGSVERLRNFQPAPSLRVASSGGGEHGYWALGEPIGAGHVRAANLKLAAALGADRNACDAARVMRLPGTFNHKRDEPVRVRIVDVKLEVYSPDDVIGALPKAEDDRPRAAAAAPPRGGGLRAIPPRIYVAELLGRKPDPGGKVRCPFPGHRNGDRTPSLHVYGTPERGWCCHGCGRGGDIFTLAALAWGLEPKRDFRKVRAGLMEAFKS